MIKKDKKLTHILNTRGAFIGSIRSKKGISI